MNKSDLGTLLRNIEKQRDAVELSGAKIRVIHAGQCQQDMKEIGNQLSDGATRYIGYFQCPKHDDISVIIKLTANPDVPYELAMKKTLAGDETQK